jgi:hypothetical protein
MTTAYGEATETRSHFGDGGPARQAGLGETRDVVFDAVGRTLLLGPRYLRAIEPDGTIVTIAGDVHPSGPGPQGFARLYASRALAAIGVDAADQRFVSVGDFGRALLVDPDPVVGRVEVVVGAIDLSPTAPPLARFAPLLQDAVGVAFDPNSRRLAIVQAGASPALRIVSLAATAGGDLVPPSRWTWVEHALPLVRPAGVVVDPTTSPPSLLVVDEGGHCVRRVAFDGTVAVGSVFGRCGERGIFAGYLNGPTNVARSRRSTALYVADTGNLRVLRVVPGEQALVIGDGSESSAGEGSPARLFPVHAPRQLATDAHGNLFITSTTAVRMVQNIDGDADADGDDRVVTLFGGGDDRSRFPASAAQCLNALTQDPSGTVHVADACQGFVVTLRPETLPPPSLPP